MKPRYYQQKSPDLIRESFKKGNKHICLLLSGGAGKSLIAKMLLEMGAAKNSKMGFFSFRKALIEQIHSYNVPSCDIGTLQKFGKTETEEYDLVIFDEKDYHNTKLKNNIKCKYSITLSGFPTCADGYPLDTFDEIIEVIQFPELVQAGFAKKVKLYSIATVDTSGLKKQGGDFHKGQSFELMEKGTVKKDIIDTYKRFCIGRKSLLFAIDTKHAESLKDEFTNAGIKCETVHSKKKETDAIIKRFENDEFDLLINVAMISIGVDIPCINTILFARPMCSVPLYMQCIWRGTRKFKDDYCLVLDLAEVIKKCDFHPMQKLDLSKKKKDKNINACKCGGTLIIFDKQIKDKTELSYTLYTVKRCDTCKNVVENEEFKIISILQCESCLKPIDRNIEMKITDKNICFDYKCDCGFSKTVREIVLSNAELKEIEYQQIMKTETWARVKKMLLTSCKRCGFKHQYAERLMEFLRDRNISIKDSIKAIDNLDNRNDKISRIMYGYFNGT